MEMTKYDAEKNLASFIFWWGWLVMLLICLFAVPPISASVFVYGTYLNYSESVLPNTSYVHQGENISQGLYYDLGGVYGFSGKLAWWKQWDNAGIGIPDKIVDLGDLNPHKLTYIDPDKFPVGPLYQWDGITCKEDSYCTSGFGNGNAYAFAVVPKAPEYQLSNRTVITHKNITVTSQNGSVETVQVTVEETIQVREIVPDSKQDVLAGNVTTLIVPTVPPTMMTVPTTLPQTLLLPQSDHLPEPTTPQIVTPKASVEYVPAMVFGAMAIAGFWRKKDGI